MFDRLGSLLKVFDDGRALVVGATKPDTEDNNRSYVAKGTKAFCCFVWFDRFNPSNYVRNIPGTSSRLSVSRH